MTDFNDDQKCIERLREFKEKLERNFSPMETVGDATGLIERTIKSIELRIQEGSCNILA